jgi:hypothetical protein
MSTSAKVTRTKTGAATGREWLGNLKSKNKRMTENDLEQKVERKMGTGRGRQEVNGTGICEEDTGKEWRVLTGKELQQQRKGEQQERRRLEQDREERFGTGGEERTKNSSL